MKIYRQGDVVIRPEKVPTGATRQESLVLAEGEVTGHSHRIVRGQAELYRDLVKGLLWLKVISDFATLAHEEHENIELPTGEYGVLIQREWDWFSEEVRQVAD